MEEVHGYSARGLPHSSGPTNDLPDPGHCLTGVRDSQICDCLESCITCKTYHCPEVDDYLACIRKERVFPVSISSPLTSHWFKTAFFFSCSRFAKCSSLLVGHPTVTLRRLHAQM